MFSRTTCVDYILCLKINKTKGIINKCFFWRVGSSTIPSVLMKVYHHLNKYIELHIWYGPFPASVRFRTSPNCSSNQQTTTTTLPREHPLKYIVKGFFLRDFFCFQTRLTIAGQKGQKRTKDFLWNLWTPTPWKTKYSLWRGCLVFWKQYKN